MMATVTRAPSTYAVEPAIGDRLRTIRTRKLAIGLASVTLVALAVLIVGMLTSMLIDWLALPGNEALRPWLTAVPSVVALVVLVVGISRVALRERLLGRAAADVDTAHPALEQRWSTLTDVASRPTCEGTHPAMFRQLTKEAVAWAPRVKPAHVVSLRFLAFAAAAVVLSLVALCGPMLFDFERTLALIERFWSPSTDITLTHFAGLPAELAVAQGEAAVLEARVVGRVPAHAQLRMRNDAGKESSFDLRVDSQADGLVTHRVSDVEKPFSFRWEAGDARSEWLTAVVVKRPKIAALHFAVTPPSYTKQPAFSRRALPPHVRVVERSKLELALRSEEPLKELQLKLGKDNVQTIMADSDGWYRWQTDVTEDFTFAPILVEPHGLTESRPSSCRVQVYRDQAPKVKVVSPTSEMAVQPNDEVDIEFTASDDFAVNRAELVVYGENAQGVKEPGELATIPIDLGDMQGAKKVAGTVKLDLSEFELKDGQSISYAVRVYDNRVAPADSEKALPFEAKVAGNAVPQATAGTQAASGAHGTPTSAQSATSQGPGSSQTAVASSVADGASSQQPANGKAGETASSATPPPTEAVAISTVEAMDRGEVPMPGTKGAAEGGAKDVAKRIVLPFASPAESAAVDPTSQAVLGSPGTSGGQSSDPSGSQPLGPAGNQTASPAGNQPPGPSGSQPAAPSESNQSAPPGSPPAAPTAEAMADQLPQATAPARDADSAAAKAREASSSATSAQSAAPRLSSQANAPAGKSAEPGSKSPKNPDPSTAADASAGGEKMPPLPPKSDDAVATTGEQSKPDTDNASTTSNRGNLLATKDAGMPPSDPANPLDEPSKATPAGEQGSVAVPEGAVALKTENESKANPGSPTAQGEPGDAMNKRMLDIPQSSSSSQMKLQIDEWAGSFDAQQREKLALAISPVLYRLGEILTDLEQLTDGVAKQLERGDPWQPEHQRLVNRAEKSLRSGEKIVADLKEQSKDTPYAFIGLQLSLIAQTHLTPARDSLWEAQDVATTARAELVRSAWQEVVRARTQLEELTQTFDRVHREHRLAETAQRVKKMYRVFIEDALEQLAPQRDGINNYESKIAEFNLDEEYLKRLKEVLEMRRDLQKELARLLTDDPRLMRRFMDRAVSQGDSLRDQLTLLSERQKQQAREVQAWVGADEADRAPLLEAIIRMRQTRLEEISSLAAACNEKFVTWLPLDLSANDPACKEVLTSLKTVAASAQLLASTSPGDARRAEQARKLYDQLVDLDGALRRVDLAAEHDALADHLLNRLADVRRLTMLTSSWIRQADYLEKGNYWQESAIEQYKLAMETDSLAGKLADIENEIAGALLTPRGGLQPTIAEKISALLATLDKELSANQLAATFALRNQQGPAAVEKETAAVAAFDKAETLFDELMRAVIDERDKLPVQDPIASLLDDPALDELLAELENESRLQDVLGIPRRPSNLRVIGDWVRPGRGGGGGGSGRMVVAKMRQDADRGKRQAEEAHRRAVARALKEQQNVDSRFTRGRPAEPKRVEWNTLLSTLGDELLQGKGKLPPQEYRQAIEQYLARISRIESEQNQEPDQAPAQK